MAVSFTPFGTILCNRVTPQPRQVVEETKVQEQQQQQQAQAQQDLSRSPMQPVLNASAIYSVIKPATTTGNQNTTNTNKTKSGDKTRGNNSTNPQFKSVEAEEKEQRIQIFHHLNNNYT